MVATQYDLTFGAGKDKTVLCAKKLTPEEVAKFRKVRGAGWIVEWIETAVGRETLQWRAGRARSHLRACGVCAGGSRGGHTAGHAARCVQAAAGARGARSTMESTVWAGSSRGVY